MKTSITHLGTPMLHYGDIVTIGGTTYLVTGVSGESFSIARKTWWRVALMKAAKYMRLR